MVRSAMEGGLVSWSRVRSKQRRQCARCAQMIDVGERAILVGDRRRKGGVWTLWHRDCHARHRQEIKAMLDRVEGIPVA